MRRLTVLIKLIAWCVIVGVSWLFGKRLSQNLKVRTDSLEMFCRALVLLESEITFSASSLDIAIKNIAASLGKSEVFLYIAKLVPEIGARGAWCEGIKKYRKDLCLTDEDMRILLSLSGELGITDCENQVKIIRYVAELLKKAQDGAQEKLLSYSKLYTNVSVGIGAIFAILLF